MRDPRKMLAILLVTMARPITGTGPGTSDDASMALLSAAQNGHLEAVQALLAKGVSPVAIAATDKGKTPVMAAASNGHVDVLQLLLEKTGINAALVVADNHGDTALLLAASGGHAHAIRLILSSTDAEHVQRLVEADEAGAHSLMMRAVKCARPMSCADAVQALLDFGVSADSYETGSSKSPRDVAAQKAAEACKTEGRQSPRCLAAAAVASALPPLADQEKEEL